MKEVDKSKEIKFLEHARAIKTILTLYLKKRLSSNELAELVGGSRSTPHQRLKELIDLNLVEKEATFGEEKEYVYVMYSLSPKGEELARKLSYVFAEKKEVVAIDKDEYDLIMAKLKRKNPEMTLEAWIIEQMKEY